MVSKFALSNILLASAALAAPSSHQGAHPVRRQDNRQSQPVNGVALFARDVPKIPNMNSYYAGAVVAEDNGTFLGVTGTFAVPSLWGNRDNDTSGFSIQVGIDGYNCTEGFQIGIDAKIVNGVSSYNAWHGSTLLNESVSDFPPITINANDVLKVTILSAATAIIENLTTGLSANRSFDYSWCGTDVEWLVGIHQENRSLPLANFGIVTITNAVAFDFNDWNSEDGIDNHYSPINHTAILSIAHNGITSTFTNTAEDSLIVQYVQG